MKKAQLPARLVLALAVTTAAAALALQPPRTEAAAEPSTASVPQAACEPGSLPEGPTQGRVPAQDYANGRAAQGYTCNTEQIGQFGTTGGLKVQRYVDTQGRQCAYYDASAIVVSDVPVQFASSTNGVVVLDMTDPSQPQRTANLTTPAMSSPHESLLVNQARGLLVAVQGNAGASPAFLDVYSIADDCREPQLLSSSLQGLLGHESGFSPDGMTYYIASTAGQTFTAVDLTDPANPTVVLNRLGVDWHGMRLNDAGTRLYVANLGVQSNFRLSNGGLQIWDVSDIQNRVPNPQMRMVSELTWRGSSPGQAAEPFTSGGRDYLFQVDEFANVSIPGGMLTYEAAAPVGAARIIDITDEANPRVVSNIRLDVHQPQARQGEQQNDPGAGLFIQGYAGHYCNVPTRTNPKVAACSMIASGLRVFNIEDPAAPVEVAYFNRPTAPLQDQDLGGAWAMAQPVFDMAREMIWYSDLNSGFYAVGVNDGILRGRVPTAPVDPPVVDPGTGVPTPSNPEVPLLPTGTSAGQREGFNSP